MPPKSSIKLRGRRYPGNPGLDVTAVRVEAFNEAIGRQADRIKVTVVDLHEERVEIANLGEASR